MNVQNTEAWNVFIERSEQGVSAVPVSLVPECVSTGYVAHAVGGTNACLQHRVVPDFVHALFDHCLTRRYDQPFTPVEPSANSLLARRSTTMFPDMLFHNWLPVRLHVILWV